MKLIDILNAKDSISKLNKIKFTDFKIVSSVYKLTKHLNEILDMVQQEQNKIISAHALLDSNNNPVIKNNQYQFAKDENRIAFIEEMNKLKQSDIDDISKIIIPIDSIQIANDITSEDMLKLEPLIEWI